MGIKAQNSIDQDLIYIPNTFDPEQDVNDTNQLNLMEIYNQNSSISFNGSKES